MPSPNRLFWAANYLPLYREAEVLGIQRGAPSTMMDISEAILGASAPSGMLLLSVD
jgi:hypothetical protein